MTKYVLIFDDVILKQLKKIESQQDIKSILSKMFDKIEYLGPLAGKLIDTKLNIYECKNKKPAVRLYFKVLKNSVEIYLFEYEIKKSLDKQRDVINKIKDKAKDLET